MEPFSPKLHLNFRFFAAAVKHPFSLGGHGMADLENQGGFADARFPAPENDGSFHNTTAQRTVHFLHVKKDALIPIEMNG